MARTDPNTGRIYNKNTNTEKYTPDVRSKILSKLIFASCV